VPPVSEPMRPRPGLPPADFFESWLPAAAVGHPAAPDAPVVQVHLSGAGGGSWRIEAGEGELAVRPLAPGPRPPAGEDAEVILRQSVADFTAAFTRDPDLP